MGNESISYECPGTEDESTTKTQLEDFHCHCLHESTRPPESPWPRAGCHVKGGTGREDRGAATLRERPPPVAASDSSGFFRNGPLPSSGSVCHSDSPADPSVSDKQRISDARLQSTTARLCRRGRLRRRTHRLVEDRIGYGGGAATSRSFLISPSPANDSIPLKRRYSISPGTSRLCACRQKTLRQGSMTVNQSRLPGPFDRGPSPSTTARPKSFCTFATSK